MTELVRPTTVPLTAADLPHRLRRDFIVEAIIEFRFETPTIFEVLLGRLVDRPEWRGFAQSRLPAYDIPQEIRAIDPSLRFAPIFQLAAPDQGSALQVGSNVVSFHRKAPYGGWSVFRPEIQRTLESLFSSAQNLTVHRIGLRYLNALTTEHRIKSIADLNLQLAVSASRITERVNINFATAPAAQTNCMVRVATREFVTGNLPAGTSVYVDVDVFTSDEFVATEPRGVETWIENAHTEEKLAFFRLFTREQISELRES